MSEIIIQCDETRIVLAPDEILHRPYYLPSQSGGQPHPSGDAIGDAIRRAAWKLLWMHGKDNMDGEQFDYGDVEVIEGNFVITFYKRAPRIPDEPGGP